MRVGNPRINGVDPRELPTLTQPHVGLTILARARCNNILNNIFSFLSSSISRFWATQLPLPKRGTTPNFDLHLLRPNGCIDQDATCYGVRPRPRRLCVRWRLCSPPTKGGGAPTQIFGPLWNHGLRESHSPPATPVSVSVCLFHSYSPGAATIRVQCCIVKVPYVQYLKPRCG